jgi:hypothetical protein
VGNFNCPALVCTFWSADRIVFDIFVIEGLCELAKNWIDWQGGLKIRTIVSRPFKVLIFAAIEQLLPPERPASRSKKGWGRFSLGEFVSGPFGLQREASIGIISETIF